MYSPDIGTRRARSIEARAREVLRIRACRGVSRSNSRSGFSVPCIAILIAHASGSLPIASFHSYSCCPRELVGVKINLEYGDLVQQERRRDSEVCKERNWLWVARLRNRGYAAIKTRNTINCSRNSIEIYRSGAKLIRRSPEEERDEKRER